MRDQSKKLKYLRSHGRNLDPRTQDEIGRRLGIKKSAMSAYASQNSIKALPDDHDAKLGAIFGFDPHWPEWRQGSFEEFRQRYEAHPAGAPPQSDDYAAQIRAMMEYLRRLPGLGNLIGYLNDPAEAAIDAARVPPEEMDDQHILDLFEFQWGYNDALAGRHPEGPGRPVSEAMSRFMDFMRGLRDRLGAGDPVDLNDEMCAALQTVLAEIEKLLNDRETDATASRALKGLKRTVNTALATRSVMLTILNDRSRLAETALAARFRAGARAIMLCIGAAGRAGLKLPDRAVFVDGDDPVMPEMVVIPAGRFIMGSPEGEEDRSKDEGPQREVRVRRFALCRHAVTFAQYDAFCAATGTKPPDDEGWGREDHPVINVSWDDAQAFVRWLNEQMPRALYRLPSEAEWEYSCRAGSDTPFEPNVAQKYRGQSIEPDEANFAGDFTYANGAKGRNRESTVPVMHPEFRPNGWGLWQMHGNVYEWCEDVYAGSYEGALPDAVAAQPIDDDTSSPRVLRGGSWYNDPGDLRSANRNRNRPDNRSRSFGFRLARTLAP